MTLTGAVDRARASFRAGLSRTGVVGPPRVRNRPRTTTNLPHRLADGTILDEDASENWWATSKNFHFLHFYSFYSFLIVSSVSVEIFSSFLHSNWEKSWNRGRVSFSSEWRNGRGGVAQKPIKKPTKPTQLSTLSPLVNDTSYCFRAVCSRRHNEAWHSIHFRYLVNPVSNRSAGQQPANGNLDRFLRIFNRDDCFSDRWSIWYAR